MPQPPIIVYRTQICPYCVAAANLLRKRGYSFEEIYLDGKADEREALQARTQFRTVPQIFVGERFVGGYTDLAEIDRSGQLAQWLALPT